MTAREIDDLSSLLGEIRARLSVIERKQDTESDRTREHREALLVTITAQATATAALDAKVMRLEERFVRVESLSDDYRMNRDRADGAARVVLFFRGLIIFIATVVGGIVTWLIGRH